MPRPPTFDDELQKLREENAEARSERDELLHRVDRLTEQLEQNSPPEIRPELFLFLFALVLVARFTLYARVEEFGAIAAREAIVSTVVLSAAAGWALFLWAVNEWERAGHYVFVKGVVLGVALVISASTLSRSIWDGKMDPHGNPTLALEIALGATVFVALPITRFIVRHVIGFLVDPLRVINKLRRKR